uniref:ketopantoate reductase family protein n=1 Tax=Candidatus Fimivicinus sp. TaxID=3056640 RepID=UPI003FF14AF2
MEIETAAVVGMGAVGSVYAKRLFDRYGERFFTIADGKRAENLHRSGVTLNGETFFPRICRPDEAAEKADLLLVCVKNYQLEAVIEEIRPFVEKDTLLLPLLNGVTATDLLRTAFPEATVFCGLAMALDAVRTEEGVIHSSDGEIHFGMEDTMRFLPQVTAVDQFLCSAGVQTHVFPHMQHAVWKKWMLNVGLNQISALTGATYGDFTRLPDVMGLAKSAMREVVHLAQAANIDLTYDDIESIPPIVATLLPEGKTSMLQDMEAGRRTEVESFAGTVLKLGRKYGVDTPFNHTLYRLIRAKEQIAQRKPLQQEK